MKNKDWKLMLGTATLVTALSVGVCLSTAGSTLNNYLADYLYSDTSPTQGECIVIGIDDYALEELGAWPWSRDIIADVIDILNEDPDNQPAAIGIDVIFSGTTEDEADDRLAESLAVSDNVILACSVNFDTQLVLNDEEIYIMDEFQISSMNTPYEEFDALVGHVNAMYDTDGVLRHHLFSFDYEGETVLSMPYQAYLLWCENQGIEAEFEPETDANGFWYVEYSRGAGEYFTYSVMDIIDGTYDPSILADAVVLIGTYDASSMDYFTTPVDRSEKMYGIEYLANVTDAMIQNVSKQYVDDVLLVIVCIWIFVYTFINLKRNIYKIVIQYFFTNVVTIVIYLVAYNMGYIMQPLWLLVGYAFALIGIILYHYFSDNKKKKYITQVFSRYVDSDIIQQLMKEDSESLGLEGKECDIAIMFIDIRGFTTLSEKMQPIEVVQMLNKYLTLTSSCIKEYDGVVDKFIGDATMAFWGAPVYCEDAVYKACQAALAMAEKAGEFTADGVTFGIGIHYGPAVVGNIGALDRMDFTAIGDTVNTAQRIEARAPKETIYISEDIVKILGDRVIATPLEEKLVLKGKLELVQVYILEGLK